jgi:hypothetical protein
VSPLKCSFSTAAAAVTPLLPLALTLLLLLQAPLPPLPLPLTLLLIINYHHHYHYYYNYIYHCMEQAAGLLRGDTAAQMAANVGAVFMPHGLGHLIGLDTHDVGGYPSGTVRDSRPGYKSLRCGRVLQENMVRSCSGSSSSTLYCRNAIQ